MRFGLAEVTRAKTLRRVGFPWNPRVGDWYVDQKGYCELVRDYDQAKRLVTNGDTFLPGWPDCRAWLADRHWANPEVIVDEPGAVHLIVTHQETEEVIRVRGNSDLDCLYSVILTIMLRERN